MKCTNCNGESNLEITLKCPYCNSLYTQEEIDRIKRGINHVVEYTIGGAEEIRLCNNAKTHLDLGEFGLASDDYREIQRLFPQNYIGWFGEAKCITNNFRAQLNPDTMSKVEKLIKNALMTANANEQQNIRSLWVPYYNNFLSAEIEKKLNKQREEEERLLNRRREEEAKRQEEQRKLEHQQAQIAADRLRQQQEELKRKTAATYSIIIEILFVALMLVFRYMKFVDDSLMGFLGVNVIMLVFVLVVTLIHKKGGVNSGVYVPSYINSLFAASIAIYAIFNVKGAITGFFALCFFGLIEAFVASLGFYIVKKIINPR